jgi:hypothetical protein
MSLQPPPAGITAPSETGSNILLRPAPTAGKETSAADVNGIALLRYIHCRLSSTVKCSKQRFLTDTGFDLCSPASLSHSTRSVSVNDLCTASGTIISTYGWLLLRLHLELLQDFTWRFVVANITHPLIGPDFLSHLCFLVDCRNNRLLDRSYVVCPCPSHPAC